MKHLSMQLYSLRGLPFLKTISNLSNIGYKGIELYGIGEMSPNEMRNILNEHNIRVVGNHIPLEKLIKNLDREFEINDKLGNQNLVCPIYHYTSHKSIEHFAEILGEIGYKCYKNGFCLLLHNHEGEFEKINDEYILDFLLKTVPDYLYLELDVFWMQFAGVDLLKYIDAKKDYCRIIHLRDYRGNKDQSNIQLGLGQINIRGILEKRLSVEYVYERVDNDLDPWQDIQHAYQYFMNINERV